MTMQRNIKLIWFYDWFHSWYANQIYWCSNGGIIVDTVYYVKSIHCTTEFTISSTIGGATFSLTTATAVYQCLHMQVQVTDTAVLT